MNWEFRFFFILLHKNALKTKLNFRFYLLIQQSELLRKNLCQFVTKAKSLLSTTKRIKFGWIHRRKDAAVLTFIHIQATSTTTTITMKKPKKTVSDLCMETTHDVDILPKSNFSAERLYGQNTKYIRIHQISFHVINFFFVFFLCIWVECGWGRKMCHDDVSIEQASSLKLRNFVAKRRRSSYVKWE